MLIIGVMVIDALTGVLVTIGVSKLVDVDVVAVAPVVIALKLVLPASCAVDVLPSTVVGVSIDTLASVLTGGIIGVVTRIGVNVLAAVLTTFESSIPVTLEMFILFCCAPLSCWPMARVLDCDCALQTWMPSCHV